jgi:aryl-alcohol dehydrogenase-like predicted oxidoreductase
MEYAKLGSTDIKVSRIGLGTWSIGGWMWGGTEESAAINTIHRALDLGINFIDTAPVYGFGQSEEIVGKALTGKSRDKVIVATKLGLEWTKDGQVFRNSSKARITQEIEDSLRRLKTDYIDLYQVHWPDLETSFAETAEALDHLRQAGKVRAIGVSNYSPAQMDQFRKTCRLESNQPPYNLLERQIEEEALPYCHKDDISVIAYGPICRGLLSGRMSSDTKFEGDDLRKVDPKFLQPRFDQYLQAVAKLDSYAQAQFGKKVIHLAVRWLLDQPGVTVALWGARKPEQLEVIGDCLGWELSKVQLQEIDEIVRSTVKEPVGPEFMAPPLKRPVGTTA